VRRTIEDETTTIGDEAINLALPCDAVAPRLARDALRRALGLGRVGSGRVADDAALVVSELVTNAVRRSGCRPDQTILFEALVTRGCVRIAVRDAGASAGRRRVRPEQEADESGLGLRLVERLARRWGSDRRDGCVVWAELAL
jgi:anti-sigma regulatory factor (Ser/Thr protein kinase)